MPAIEFIYFDLGNVLLNFSHELACQQIAEAANVADETVWQVVFEEGLQIKFETGLISGSEFHAEFCQLTGAQLLAEDLLHAYSDIFTVNLSLLPLLTELTSMHWPLGILSNTCQAHWEFVVKRFGFIRELFSVQILSFEARAMKPNPQIYHSAIAGAGVQPNQIWFTDDRADNVAGALQLGIDAELFESERKLRRDLRQRGIDV